MKTTKYIVNSTPQLIVPAEQFTRTVYIHSATGSIYLGAATNTDTSAGLHIPNGNTLSVTVPPNETIYAIDGAGGATAIVLDWSATD